MSRSIALFSWVLGLGLLFVGERFFGDGAALRWPATGLGVVLALVALGSRLKDAMAGSAASRPVLMRLVVAYAVGLGGLALYFASALGVLGEEAETASLALRVAWPIAMLCGTLPALAMERSLL